LRETPDFEVADPGLRDPVEAVPPRAPGLEPPAPLWVDTRRTWQAFAASRPEPPNWADCAPRGTKVTDHDPRLLFHGQMRYVRTPAYNTVLLMAHDQMRANRTRARSRAGIIIHGPRNTGKTVLLQSLGLYYERKIQRLYAKDENRTPVIALSVPAPMHGGMRNWAGAFAKFLGLERDGGSDPTRAVCHVMRASGTLLVLIDGIERLRGRDDARQTFAFLDYISEQTGATFVYCGRGARAIVGPRTADTQTALLVNEEPWGDHAVLRTSRIDFSDQGKGTFATIVDGFDKDLRLFEHQRKDLTALSPYLHKRSKGYLRALSQLVCQGAQKAIITGEERITEELLDSLYLGRTVLL